MNNITRLKYVCLILLVLGFSGCSTLLYLMRIVKDFRVGDKLKDNEVLIIGNVEIDPPFTDSDFDIEQRDECWKGDFEKQAHLWIDHNFNEYPPELYDENDTYGYYFRNRIIAGLNKEFYVKFKKKSFYIMEIFMLRECYYTYNYYRDTYKLNITSYRGKINFKVNVKPDDQAIYIGTIKYTRNGYNIVKSKLIDNFDRVKQDFIEKFGDGIKIRKSIMVSAKR